MFEGFKGVIVVVACLALLGVLVALKVQAAEVGAVGVVTTLIAWVTRSPASPPPAGPTLVALLGFGIVAGQALACGAATPDRAVRAFDVAGHSAALAECRAEGKDAGSYAVYGRCADEVDRKFGLTGPDGGVK